MRSKANRSLTRNRAWSAAAMICALGTFDVGCAFGQTQAASGYPVRPSLLPEGEEIALAASAAPAEISSEAEIYVLRSDGPAKVRVGSNGCACMVSRDLHEGSLYPICFDREGTQTLLRQELMELTLRSQGKTEDQVRREVAVAFASGKLRTPNKSAIAYMMSSRQVLFSSPGAEGVRIGPWHPHLMISVPYATGEQFGLKQTSSVDFMSLDHSGQPGAQLIVQVPRWADTTAEPR